MDSSSIAGAALLMKTAQTQQTMTVSAMKMAAEQQTKIADLLAQNTAQLPQSTAQNTEFTFSTYA
jgi:uncharacterized caspase-like protein